MNKFEQQILDLINSHFRDEVNSPIEEDDDLCLQAKQLIADPNTKLKTLNYFKSQPLPSTSEADVSLAVVKSLLKCNGSYLTNENVKKIGISIKCTKKALKFAFVIDTPIPEEPAPVQMPITTPNKKQTPITEKEVEKEKDPNQKSKTPSVAKSKRLVSQNSTDELLDEFKTAKVPSTPKPKRTKYIIPMAELVRTNDYLISSKVYQFEPTIYDLFNKKRNEMKLEPLEKDDYATPKLMELHRRILLRSEKISRTQEDFEDFSLYAPKKSRDIFTYNQEIPEDGSFEVGMFPSLFIDEFFKRKDSITLFKTSTTALISVFQSRDLISGVVLLCKPNKDGKGKINLYGLTNEHQSKMLLNVIYYNINALRSREGCKQLQNSEKLKTEMMSVSKNYHEKLNNDEFTLHDGKYIILKITPNHCIISSKNLLEKMAQDSEYKPILLGDGNYVGIGIWKGAQNDSPHIVAIKIQ